MNEMVLDPNSNPAFCDSPEVVRGWIQARLKGHPECLKGYTVRTGWPEKRMPVDEYLKRYTNAGGK